MGSDFRIWGLTLPNPESPESKTTLKTLNLLVQYWDDPADLLREHEGTLLLLWAGVFTALGVAASAVETLNTIWQTLLP